jgi:hypothetical protein
VFALDEMRLGIAFPRFSLKITGVAMQLRKPDSPVKRVALAVAGGTALVAVLALAFMWTGSSPPPEKVNGMRIVAGALAFSRKLQMAHLPIPQTVKLDELAARGFLRPEDVAPFKGADADVLLAGPDAGPKTMLMRVRLPDGTAFVLLADGSVQQIER